MLRRRGKISMSGARRRGRVVVGSVVLTLETLGILWVLIGEGGPVVMARLAAWVTALVGLAFLVEHLRIPERSYAADLLRICAVTGSLVALDWSADGEVSHAMLGFVLVVLAAWMPTVLVLRLIALFRRAWASRHHLA